MNPMSCRTRVLLFTLTFALLVPISSRAQAPPPGTIVRPASAGAGAVVVPDRFLRRWDPVTVFFDQDRGTPGQPEDRPEPFVSLEPRHPGAFEWVDARTLQFRPADPWPPLERFTWSVGGVRTVLTTLMAAPLATVPEQGADGLEPVEAITLTFPEPLPTEALARMVTVELRPLPGVDRDAARWLNREDFTVKTMDRSGPADPASYVLELEQPIPLGTRALVHLRLALDDTSPRSFYELAFATAAPFRVVAVGSHRVRFPVAPEGTRYPPEQPLDGGSRQRALVVEFSSEPEAVDAVVGRNLVRLQPPVPDLDFALSGRTLEVSGGFAWDTLYRVTLAPAPVRDRSGRTLEMDGPSEMSLFFPRPEAFLRWGASQGVVELHGPHRVPVEGRGHERFDLRVYPVDPFDRDFWPFPEAPVPVDESERPPGPGETPELFTQQRHIREWELRERLTTLGSPPVSTLVELPLRREGAAARFGLDLEPHLARLSGPRAAGHYLVGLRPLGETSERQWMRIQVTDLSLTTVEEPDGVRFVVTSLDTGRPVTGATVRVEIADHRPGPWSVLVSGTTDGDGAYSWSWRQPPELCQLLRLSVTDGSDVLVLDPTRPPQLFADGTWSDDAGVWPESVCGESLRWALEPEELAHLFTERPVYRPGDEVHLKGYVRSRTRGRLGPLPLSDTFVVISGPGDLEWREPVELTAEGSFYYRFEEEEPPTGVYRAVLEGRLSDERVFTSEPVSFRVEAYRIPRFEVELHAPDRAPLDRPFDVALTATYYAGGRVAERPVAWRVTQFPYTFTPAAREGFLFSSDARFSREPRFEATPAREEVALTDDSGSATLTVDPTVEPTSQPRTYVVEATVTGADDQTVTSTRRVVALPPFVLGLKLPRFLPRAEAIEPELLAIGPDGEPLPGLEMTVRLLHRQWHSTLRASDFSDGVARYLTDVVDEPVTETTVESGPEPVRVTLSLPEAGVYVVELEARDRVGRSQVVTVDLYAGGPEPVAWAKPATRSFTVATDRERYAPGDTATLVLASPYQAGRALAVVETPDGNRYRWVEVSGGKGVLQVPVEGSWAPRLPVHLVLERGRVPGTEPVPGSATDLGKPATLATTVWLEVDPRSNRVEVALEHPERALPGAEVEVAIRLSDPDGRPLSGEVTLWLVDAAVLALGREQRLDPLPDLIRPAESRVRVHDTREMPFGILPLAELPGGGEGEDGRGVLDRATVRRQFKTVPFYDPRIMVGPDGEATVSVQLPDNLTTFKLRAKAASGFDRFGFATGELAVRLPVIVQPALPRFVRPGDRFTASAIGRVVEGEGGPGRAEIRVDGATLDGPATVDLDWAPNRPERLDFPLQVPTPGWTADGELERTEVTVAVGVERTSDSSRDAFEVRLPIRDDRRRVSERLLADLEGGGVLELPAIGEPARPGSVRRSVMVSDQPAVVRMAAGLDLLLEYPYGCTEQRVSRARAVLALARFRDLLAATGGNRFVDRTVRELLEALPAAVDWGDLVAYWPGTEGSVTLTAWTVDFLVEARDAGYPVDPELTERLLRSLERALRSDYGRFVDGESWAERSFALAALAHAGRFNPPYAAELARKAQYLDLEATAQVLSAFARSGQGEPATTDRLRADLWKGLVLRLHQGREAYGGLQVGFDNRNGLILPSETRTLAEVTRALARTDADAGRLPVLVDGLVRLGRGDGWGSTNASSAALLALSEVLTMPDAAGQEQRLEVRLGERVQTLALGPGTHLAHATSDSPGAGRLRLVSGQGPVVVRASSSFIPAADGSQVAAAAGGFVVSRELLLVQPGGAPPKRVPVDRPGTTLTLETAQVVEEHCQVVNPENRHFVAVVIPLAAGMEPLNPNLATAPPEAAPAGSLTLEPTYAAYLDDQVAFYYNTLPKGTYDFSFRVRATVPGRFVQPPALAEMMYDAAVRGNGNGAIVEITAKPE